MCIFVCAFVVVVIILELPVTKWFVATYNEIYATDFKYLMKIVVSLRYWYFLQHYLTKFAFICIFFFNKNLIFSPEKFTFSSWSHSSNHYSETINTIALQTCLYQASYYSVQPALSNYWFELVLSIKTKVISFFLKYWLDSPIYVQLSTDYNFVLPKYL